MAHGALTGTTESDLDHLMTQLPCGMNAEAKSIRKNLFATFDPNGNGVLSLAEVDKGLEARLAPATLPKQVVNRAFQAARTLAEPVAEFSDDYIDANEFRLFLSYLHHYLELWRWFCKMDTSNDRRVSLEEFKASLPLLQGWAKGEAFEAAVADPGKAFKEVDADGGGMVLFDEFAHWALSLSLQSLLGCETSQAERAEAVEMLKKQTPNLASAEEASTTATSAPKRAARPRSASREKLSVPTPTAQQLSANRLASAKAKSKSGRPPSSGPGSRRSSRGASPSPAQPSAGRFGAGSSRPPTAPGSSRGPSPAPGRSSRGPSPAPGRSSRGPSPAAGRVAGRGPSSSSGTTAGSQARAGSHGRPRALPPSRPVCEDSVAAALARGRHTGPKGREILAGGYSAGYR
eukprot:TRINITY_DN28702_c0_g2_i2.p2 TRINITY_DN28702_c0_g2~~TRINITY_DN28702_c0_g2_i2.p2  ORF type:complete len:404 (-),score=74.54 TRINITY_DN28702_c0_g2_i2:19-1230(-)